MVKQLLQDIFKKPRMQYSSQSAIEKTELEDISWDADPELKVSERRPEAVERGRGDGVRQNLALRPARSQRTLKTRFFDSVLRPALRGLCLITCCIGCPNDPMFKNEMQVNKSEDNEVVLRIINAEEQQEPETDDDWDALSGASYSSWEQRTSVPQRDKTDPEESEVTYYDEESGAKKADRGKNKLKKTRNKSLSPNIDERGVHLGSASPNPFGTLEFIEEGRDTTSPWKLDFEEKDREEKGANKEVTKAATFEDVWNG